MEQQKTGFHAVVSFMGHTKLAGYIDEYTMGGQSFMRITIPEIPGIKSWDRLFTASSVYSIDPCSEETAFIAAQRIKAAPMNTWDIRSAFDEILKKEGNIIVSANQLPAAPKEEGDFMYGKNDEEETSGESDDYDGSIYDNDTGRF